MAVLQIYGLGGIRHCLSGTLFDFPFLITLQYSHWATLGDSTHHIENCEVCSNKNWVLLLATYQQVTVPQGLNFFIWKFWRVIPSVLAGFEECIYWV